ncbi:MAG: hypothetical protein HXX20_24200 [Chloroflexi bacterium]|nr:hypothetical protein [Chloroflexota bacterium]
MPPSESETHRDSDLKNEKMLKNLIESLVRQANDRNKTEKEQNETLKQLRATLNI